MQSACVGISNTPSVPKVHRDKTTELLHISQSAISRHMAQLEDELRRKASGAGHCSPCGRISGNRRAWRTCIASTSSLTKQKAQRRIILIHGLCLL